MAGKKRRHDTSKGTIEFSIIKWLHFLLHFILSFKKEISLLGNHIWNPALRPREHYKKQALNQAGQTVDVPTTIHIEYGSKKDYEA